MRLRSRLLVLLVTGVVLVMAAPALAKGVDQVTIAEGEQRLTLGWTADENGPLQQILGAARMYDGLWVEPASQRQSDPPTGFLGEAIALEWRFPDLNADLQLSVVVQYVYLDAEGGPVAHIPGDQSIYDDLTVESWFPVSPTLRDSIARAGFDLSAPATGGAAADPSHGDPGPAPDTAPPEPASGGALPTAPAGGDAPWLWIAAAVAGALATFGLVQSGLLRRLTRRAV